MTTVKRKLNLDLGPKRRRRVKRNSPPPGLRTGKTPRISRLMALAIQYDAMLRSGEVADLGEIARRGHVSQPRVSQILSLNLLAPDIQEELLHLPLIEKGRDPIHEKSLRQIASTVDWEEQRGQWAVLQEAVSP